MTYAPLLIAATAGLAFGLVVSWIVAARYGAWPALAIPVLAAVSSLGLIGPADLGEVIMALTLVGPVVLGAGLAVLIRARMGSGAAPPPDNRG